jgi:hypothetical protein
MKHMRLLLKTFGLLLAGGLLVAADHADAPAVKDGTSDITDLYAFQGENTNNIVFAGNLQGLLSPGSTAMTDFDEDVLIEFNIDNNGDNVEDLVIQAIPKDGKMYFFGPVAPSNVGTTSTIATGSMMGSVDITGYGNAAITGNENGMSFFAGPRDDPFFFDLGRYKEIIAGTAPGFNSPGTDTFAGTNVLSVVVEVPKSMLGGTGMLNVWLETKERS